MRFGPSRTCNLAAPLNEAEPYHEALSVTLLRTVSIGLAVGLAASRLQGRPSSWLQWTMFGLWLSFGGHWVELFYLNRLRPRLGTSRWPRVAGRLLTWMVGGTILMAGARLTVLPFSTHASALPPWWLGGPLFVGLELLVHALPQLRGQPNFYNGLR